MKFLKVLPYNSVWPQIFAEEAKLIQQALGDNCIEIHHIGSTAVEGLSAKPTIDILPVVKDITKLPEAIAKMAAIGYESRGEYNIPFRHSFTKKTPYKVHVHIFEQGNSEIELNILFRDYLRNNPIAAEEYAELKQLLLTKDSSYEKNEIGFTGYTLGKDEFIRNILKQAGFNGIGLKLCLHNYEWEAAKYFRQKYFFDKIKITDPYSWTFNNPEHWHFVLYQGPEIIGYAHIQAWPDLRAAMRIIVIDEAKRNNNFGQKFLALCEKWLKNQAYKSIHVESSPAAFTFYKKNGYIEMPFNDPDEYECSAHDIAMGKQL